MRCLCTGRLGIRCDAAHCDIAGPGAPGDRNSCRICWNRLGLNRRGESLASRVVAVDPPRPPGHEDKAALNCSLLDLSYGRTLFAYRCGWAGARIALCELDRDHRPGPSWLLETPGRLPQDPSGQEDPRLFLHNGDLHCSYIGVRQGPKGLDMHQCLMRLSPDGRRVLHSWCPHYPDRAAWEKNWAFFSHNSQLYAVYSINPHRVLHIHEQRARLVHETPGPDPAKGDQLRGGAPPVLVGSEWYHWFHGKVSRVQNSEYWIGLYTFEATPPFRPLRYARQRLLTPHRADRPLPTVPHAVFPCGAVLRGDRWVISYGYYDHHCRIAEFDAGRVEGWLRPVVSGGPGTELKALLSSLGIEPSNCQCNARAREMDEKGTDWCSANVDTIAGWLREPYAKAGWLEKLTAAARAVAGGLLLNPLDPLPGLVREAILRAREGAR